MAKLVGATVFQGLGYITLLFYSNSKTGNKAPFEFAFAFEFFAFGWRPPP
jgi:hypothetical protein